MSKKLISTVNKNFPYENKNLNPNSDFNNMKMQLKEEKLDIYKNIVQTGKVNVYKETIKHYKTVIVPVIKENLVIKSHIFNDKKHKYTETIRIPISEEHFELTKYPVTLENVDIYSKKFQSIEQIETVLRKEKLRVQTTGSAKVIETQSTNEYS